jgi:uncharacterized repeat protein (TIGR03803 family)
MILKEIYSRSSQVFAVSLFTLLLVTSSWAASIEEVLHVFQGTPGTYPTFGVISDAAGNLYGTTTQGGHAAACGSDSGCGIIFKLTPNSTGWSYSVLYVFKGGQDGASPIGSLVFDGAGNLYGATATGGDSKSCVGGCGTVFELTPTSSGGWTESVLYRFQGASDGEAPAAGVVFDDAGNLYGTTGNGGTGCRFSCGTVYELSPSSGGGWREQILYNFQGANGNTDAAYPDSGLIFDASGSLYGTSAGGGAGPCSGSLGGCGTVFELAPKSGGGWTESVLYRFQGSQDGQAPFGVVLDPSGNLYGSTTLGGSKSDCGTVFELTPQSGAGWHETILRRFRCDKAGGYPDGVIRDPAGNIYGSTLGLDVVTDGTVFELSLSSGKWTLNVLRRFTGSKGGNRPSVPSLDSTSTHLFGTTFYEGANFSGFGVVFEITP